MLIRSLLKTTFALGRAKLWRHRARDGGTSSIHGSFAGNA